MRSEVALEGFSAVGHGGAKRGDRLRFAVVVLLVGVAAAAGSVAAHLTCPVEPRSARRRPATA